MESSWRGSEDGHSEPAWAGVCRPTSLEPWGGGLGTNSPAQRRTWHGDLSSRAQGHLGAKALEQWPLKVAQYPCPRWAAGEDLAASASHPPPRLHFQESFHCRCSGFKGCLGGLACDLLMQCCPPGWEDPGPSEHLRGRGASFPAVGGCVLVSLLTTCPCPPPGPCPWRRPSPCSGDQTPPKLTINREPSFFVDMATEKGCWIYFPGVLHPRPTE